VNPAFFYTNLVFFKDIFWGVLLVLSGNFGCKFVSSGAKYGKKLFTNRSLTLLCIVNCWNRCTLLCMDCRKCEWQTDKRKGRQTDRTKEKYRCPAALGREKILAISVGNINQLPIKYFKGHPLPLIPRTVRTCIIGDKKTFFYIFLKNSFIDKFLSFQLII